jgi:hypothetical protein
MIIPKVGNKCGRPLSFIRSQFCLATVFCKALHHFRQNVNNNNNGKEKEKKKEKGKKKALL